MTADLDLETLPVDARRGRLAVELDWIGEGRGGRTYDPKDPSDRPYVRADINVDGLPRDDASVLTGLTADLDEQTAQRAAYLILDRVQTAFEDGQNIANATQLFEELDRTWSMPDLNLAYREQHLKECVRLLLESYQERRDGTATVNAEAAKALDRATEEYIHAGGGDRDLQAAAANVCDGFGPALDDASVPVSKDGLENLSNTLQTANRNAFCNHLVG